MLGFLLTFWMVQMGLNNECIADKRRKQDCGRHH